MTIGTITDDAALAGLWPDWAALWRQAPDASPFTSPAWLQPWWEVFGTGAPVVATRRGGGALVGLLPLYRLGGKLLPIGVGLSDYTDILLGPDAPPGTADQLVAAALAAGGVDRCDVPELPPAARLLQAAPPPGWTVEPWNGPPCPVLRLGDPAAIPKGMQRDIRQARNRAGRAGGWTVQRADAASQPAMLDALIRLHGARWHGRGEPGVLADPDVQRFHRLAGRTLLAAGLLRMEALVLRDGVAAVILALVSPGRIYFYLSGFSDDFGFESPGTILLAHMIDTAVAEGRTEAHFLRGDEAYKYAWGATDRGNAGRSFIRQRQASPAPSHYRND